MTNATKVTEYLTLDRAQSLEEKVLREAQAGWPLNTAISVRFLGDHLLPLDRCSKSMKDVRRKEVFDVKGRFAHRRRNDPRVERSIVAGHMGVEHCAGVDPLFRVDGTFRA